MTSNEKAVPIDVESSGEISVGQVEEVHLRRQFSFWSTLGLIYSLTAVPISMGNYMAFSIGLGGGPFFIWGFIFSAFMNSLLCLPMAEMSALYPHMSGKYSNTTS